MPMLRLVTVLVGLLLSTSAVSSDLAKENRWVEQVVDALLDGEAVYLDDGRAPFMAIETESAGDGPADKAVIVMHGTGVHPDWPTVILPLRVGLTESGWHTLSIQMPVLPNEAEHAEYAAIYDWVPGRIDAALAYLRDKGFKTVVLVAHSQGATMATYYLSGADRPVDGFVAIGMSGGIADGPMDSLAQLPSIRVPMLDLYGGEDLPEVMHSAPARAAAVTDGIDFQQSRVDGADHFFDGEESELLDRVNRWLASRF